MCEKCKERKEIYYILFANKTIYMYNVNKLELLRGEQWVNYYEGMHVLRLLLMIKDYILYTSKN